jgi:hypothetical protein
LEEVPPLILEEELKEDLLASHFLIKTQVKI